MSTTPSPDIIWDDTILKGNVEKDDLFWTEYLDEAAVFDRHLVEGWRETVDIIFIYVSYFLLPSR